MVNTPLIIIFAFVVALSIAITLAYHYRNTIRPLTKNIESLKTALSSTEGYAKRAAMVYQQDVATLRKELSQADYDIDIIRDRNASYLADIKALRDQLANIKKVNKRLHTRLVAPTKLVSIRFMAHVPHEGWRKTEFKHGVGPCGLTVCGLHWEEVNNEYILTQTCTNGERKVFHYSKTEIAGRIEFKYLD